MKRSLKSAVLSLCTPIVLAGVLAGCGDTGGATPDSSSAAAASGTGSAGRKAALATDSAKPTQSAPLAEKAAAPNDAKAEADTSAKPGAPTPTTPPATPATPVSGPASAMEVAKVLPADCSGGRIYANIGKIATPELQATLDGMRTKMMAGLGGKVDAEKVKKLEQLSKDANMQAAAQDVGVCIGTGKDAMIAMSFDSSKMKGNLADVMVQTIELATGTAPAKTEDGGVTYLKVGEQGVLAFSGSLMIFGKSIEAVKASTAAKAGGAGFSGADSNVLWLKLDGKNVRATVTEAGSDYNVKLSMPAPTKEIGEAMKKDAAAGLKMAEEQLQKAAAGGEKIIPGLGALAKKIKLSADGDNIVAEMLLPKQTIIDIITKLGNMDLSKMRGM